MREVDKVGDGRSAGPADGLPPVGPEGEMARLGHDINNKLSKMLLLVGTLERQLTAGHSPRVTLDRLKASIRETSGLLRPFWQSPGARTAPPEPVSLYEVARRHAEGLHGDIEDPIDVRIQVGTRPTMVAVEPTDLDRVLSNLTDNACRALRATEDRKLEISVDAFDVEVDYAAGCERLARGRYVRLEVADNGQGMSREALERLFDDGFTTSPEGQGLGMGIVRTIVAHYGGRIDVASAPEVGTRVTVHWPRHEPPRADD